MSNNELFNIFKKYVKLQPKEIAIIFKDLEISYLELFNEVNSLTQKMLEQEVVGPVALVMDKSVLAISSMLACWNLGLSFLPTDSSFPKVRINQYLSIAGCSHSINSDGDVETISSEDASSYDGYIMFTSGSTGEPKPVQVSVENIRSLINAWSNYYELPTFIPKVLQVASISTDVFIGDMLKALFFGGTLILADGNAKKDIRNVVSIIEKHLPNIIESTPVYIRLILEAVKNEEVRKSLKQIIVGGEACSVGDYKWLVQNYPNARVVNGYGVTECTIESVVYETNDIESIKGENMPIGKPLENTNVYVVDKDMNPIDSNVVGELLIGGSGVSRGYLDAVLNNDKFVLFKNEIVYRTGDRASRRVDGEMIYHGRLDDQVQVNGYRVELGEVESIISSIIDVNDVVVLKEDRSRTDEIVAFVKTALSLDELELKIKGILPGYMLPKVFVVASISRMLNGKVDRQKMLSLADNDSCIQSYKGNTSKIIEIIEEVLGNKINMNISLLDQGADSLIVIKILHKLKQIGFIVSIADVYSAVSVLSFVNNLLEEKKNHEIKYEINNKGYLEKGTIKQFLKELRQKEIVFFNRLLVAGSEKIINLDLWGNSFRKVHRHVYSIEYVLIEDVSKEAVIERHFLLLQQQELLRSSFNNSPLSWNIYNCTDNISPIILDLRAYSINESQVLGMFPFIKEYFLVKDKLSNFPYRHFLVQIEANKYIFVFCMDESIHNKVGADILKNYMFGLNAENTVQYSEYLDILHKGPLLSNEEVAGRFQLMKFVDAMKAFPKYSQKDLNLYEHEFKLGNTKDSYAQSLHIFQKMLKYLFKAHVPFFMVQDTRVFQNNKFRRTIGEFTDFIPCIAELSESYEELLLKLNSLRKEAVDNLVNIKFLKWSNSDKYEYKSIRKFTDSFRMEKEGTDSVVAFHYRTEYDDSAELYPINDQTETASWIRGVTFNFSVREDKLYFRAYLPCDIKGWEDMLGAINETL